MSLDLSIGKKPQVDKCRIRIDLPPGIAITSSHIKRNILKTLSETIPQFREGTPAEVGKAWIQLRLDPFGAVGLIVEEAFANGIPVAKNQSFIVPQNVELFIAQENEHESHFSIEELPQRTYSEIYDYVVASETLKRALFNYCWGVLNHKLGRDQTLKLNLNKQILLYGPTGCGKSTLALGVASRVAEEMIKQGVARHFYLLRVDASKLFSKWFGETVERIAGALRELMELSMQAPAILIFDEIDILGRMRPSSDSTDAASLENARAVTSLLNELDSIRFYGRAVIIATTNVGHTLDTALLDRFDLRLEIGLPNIDQRKQIISNAFRASGTTLTEKELSSLSGMTEGFTGRDLCRLPWLLIWIVEPNKNLPLPERLAWLQNTQIARCLDPGRFAKHSESDII